MIVDAGMNTVQTIELRSCHYGYCVHAGGFKKEKPKGWTCKRRNGR